MIGTIRGVITLVLMLLFITLTVWAWGKRRKPVFDAMARLPLEDDQNPPSGSKSP